VTQRPKEGDEEGVRPVNTSVPDAGLSGLPPDAAQFGRRRKRILQIRSEVSLPTADEPKTSDASEVSGRIAVSRDVSPAEARRPAEPSMHDGDIGRRLKAMEDQLTTLAHQVSEHTRGLRSLGSEVRNHIASMNRRTNDHTASLQKVAASIEKQARSTTAAMTTYVDEKVAAVKTEMVDEIALAVSKNYEDCNGLVEGYAEQVGGWHASINNWIGDWRQYVEEQLEDIDAILDRIDQKPAYFTLYKTTPTPTTGDEVFRALENFITVCGRKFCLLDQADVGRFLQDNFELADPKKKPVAARLIPDVAYIGARLWTADIQIRLKVYERHSDVCLYHLLGKANRDNDIDLLTSGGVVIQKAINSHLVSRTGAIQNFPHIGSWEPRHSHRGAGIKEEALAFWSDLKEKGDKKYRCPTPLASSINETVAFDFLHRVDTRKGLAKVHFIFHWEAEGDNPCLHARYIAAESAVNGEAELLLAGYSALELIDYNYDEEVKMIQLKVLRDNKEEKEYLPLTEWH